MRVRLILCLLLAPLFIAPLLPSAEATVSSTTTSVSYTGNGATTAYSIPFPFLTNSHISVTVAGVTQTLGSHYTLSGAGSATGTCTFLSAPANAAAIVITRTVPYTQATSFRTQGSFNPKLHEDALDKLTMEVQQVTRDYTAADDTIRAQITGLDGGYLDSYQVVSTGSTTARRLKDRFAETIKVTDYGALCDGTSNDASAFQAAITAATGAFSASAVGAHQGHGQVIEVPGGKVCALSSQLTFPTTGGILVRSNGRETAQLNFTVGTGVDAIIYQGSGSGGDPLTRGGGFENISIACTTCRDVISLSYNLGFSIKNVYVRGGARYGLKVINPVDLYVSDTKIDNNTTAGLYVGQDAIATSSTFDHIYITNTGTSSAATAADIGGFNIVMVAPIIEATTATGTAGTGIKVRSGTATIISPYFEANTGDQIVIGDGVNTPTVSLINPYFNVNAMTSGKYGLNAVTANVTVLGGNWDAFSARTVYIAANQRVWLKSFPASAPAPVLASGGNINTYEAATIEKVDSVGRGNIQAGTFTSSTTTTSDPGFTCVDNACKVVMGAGTNAYLKGDGTGIVSGGPLIVNDVGATGTPFQVKWSGAQVMYVHQTGNIAVPGVWDLQGFGRVALNNTSHTEILGNSAATGANAVVLDNITAQTTGNILLLQTGDISKGFINFAGFYATNAQQVTISSNGAGTAAAYTLTPSSDHVELTCNDADGCDVTLAETNALSGELVTITNMGTNTINFADSAGVTELAGAFAAGQYDTLTLRYVNDRFVEVVRSNN